MAGSAYHTVFQQLHTTICRLPVKQIILGRGNSHDKDNRSLLAMVTFGAVGYRLRRTRLYKGFA